MTQEIVKIDAAQFGIEENKAKEIAAQFQPMLDKMIELETEFNAILERANTEINQSVVSEAKALRLKYVKIRTGTSDIHKAQKAFYLAGGRFVDGWKNAQEFASQGIESKLEAIEKHFENIEKERIAKLQSERSDALQLYGVDTTHLSLGTMSDEVWDNFFAGTKLNYENRIAAEKKAEAEKLENERKQSLYRDRLNEIATLRQFMTDDETFGIEMSDEDYSALFHSLLERKSQYEAEQERIRQENERLKKEADQHESQLKKEREEAEAERKRIDAERKKAEDELAAEKKRIEDKERAKAQAEEKARKDAEKEAKKASAAPDKDKLIALSNQLKVMELPTLKTDEANAILREVQVLLGKVCNHIETKCTDI